MEDNLQEQFPQALPHWRGCSAGHPCLLSHPLGVVSLTTLQWVQISWFAHITA